MDFEAFAAAELAVAARKLTDAAEARVASEVAAALAAERAQANAVLARTTLDAQEQVATAHAEAEATVSRMRSEADAAVAAARANNGDLVDQVRLEAARLQAEGAEELARARSQAQADIANIRLAAEAEIAVLREAAESAARTNASFGSMIEKLRDDRTQLAADNERLATENAALTYERADLVERAQSSSRGPFISRLGAAIRQISIAATVEDVLAATAGGLASELPRVAVLLARDNALVPVFHHGFDPDGGIAKVAIPLGVDSFLTNAMQSGDTHVLRPTAGGIVPFGGNPTLCISGPIAVRGQSLAVIYADDAGRPVQANGGTEHVDLTTVLQAYATLRLERLTIDLKAIAELRAYAQMLLDEVEYVYDGDGASKKPEAERVERLAENLRCARQIYSQRVTPDGPAAAALLEDAITRTIERKGSQPFGRDLRTAHTRQSGAPPHATARAS